MARGRPRPERRPGRQSRTPVPAITPFDLFGDDPFGFPGPDDPEGSAGVREPRRPRPSGPLSGAGERPVPEPFLVAALPDPRS